MALGIIYALLNAALLAGMALFSKLLSVYYGPIEVTFFRNFISVLVLFVILLCIGKLSFLKTKRPGMHVIRSAIGTVGIVLGNWALSIMPLAETTILLFTSPLWTVLLSYPILGEKVGIQRLGAVAVGFLGIILIASPSSSVDQLPLLGICLGLAWGLMSGAVDICLRKMGGTENAMATTFYFVLFGTIATSFHWPWAQVQEGAMSIDAFWIVMGLGVVGVLALLAKTQSFRLAEASLIAPIMYSMIIWSLLFDYLFWGSIPSMNVIGGAAIIIASNIFILYRETRAKKEHKELNA